MNPLEALFMEFTEMVDLAAEALGGSVLWANDEFFAHKENLLKRKAAIFIEDKYTDWGKWMDGWETRRRRSPRLDEPYDECIIRLGAPGRIAGVNVDTSFFRGNFPSHCSLEACIADGNATIDQLRSDSTIWHEILPVSELQGDSHNLFAIESDRRATHLRFKIYPDGGVARFRVHGTVEPDWDAIRARGSEIDLAAVENGGSVPEASDMFFGHRHNLIMPGRALDMSDGWESKRRRGPGYDWCIIRLGAEGTIQRVEVDTWRFKGNYPESCMLEVGRTSGGDMASIDWKQLLANTKLQAHTLHTFEKELADIGPVTHARFNIYPDGGVSRLRLWGRV